MAYRAFFLAILLLTLPARAPAEAIYCGPGTGNCGATPAAVRPPRILFEATGPGTFRMIGASITITYDPVGDDFTITWQGHTRTRISLEEAGRCALEWAATLRSYGFEP